MAAFTRYSITADEILIVDEALEAVSAIREDHSFYESELITEIVRRSPVGGTDNDRHRHAKKLMHAHNQRDTGEDLVIPGMPPRPLMPENVDADIVTAILDLSGQGMEHDDINTMIFAHYPKMKPHDLLPYWDFYLEYVSWEIASKKIQYELFAVWDEQERAKGRPESELVFGNFIREANLLYVNEQ